MIPPATPVRTPMTMTMIGPSPKALALAAPRTVKNARPSASAMRRKRRGLRWSGLMRTVAMAAMAMTMR